MQQIREEIFVTRLLLLKVREEEIPQQEHCYRKLEKNNVRLALYNRTAHEAADLFKRSAS